ncbi:MAG: hypothetical protein RL276_1404 [Bacteroidota bacterium]
MRRQPKPWVAELGWAGLFLALFILNEWHATPPPEPVWAEFPKLPPAAEFRSSYPRRDSRARVPYDSLKRTRLPKQRIRVASDTVSAPWLQSQGWPDWKAQGLVRDRGRWGGVDSLLAARWDDRQDFLWDLNPPSPMDLNTVPEDQLYAHPLWRAPQVRALHRFRSRVRPLRSLSEVFALAPFDSAQKVQIPLYFYVGK